MEIEQAIEKLTEAGREAGKNAASWYFDGNTDRETYRRVWNGISAGDPAILDTFPSCDLSGQWADAPTPTSIMRDVLDLDAHAEATWNHDAFTDCMDAYEQAFNDAAADEIGRVCALQLYDTTEYDPTGHVGLNAADGLHDDIPQ